MIELPWPPKELQPNYMKGWRAKKDARKKYKEDCYLCSLRKPIPIGESIGLTITFHPPDRRHRDLDNCLAAIKLGLDGVALSWDVDDKIFHPITIDWGEPVKHGKVCIYVKT